MLFELYNFFKNHLIKYPTPLALSYAWSFGALTGIFLSIQLVTGVLLGFHYDAGEFAFESVEYIMRDVNYGWLLRYLHANSASFYFLCMFIHVARGIFYKSYLSPRHYAWNSGVFILLLSIVTAFLGYVLPWGQMSYWAATAIIKLLTILTIVGEETVIWLWDGFVVASLTLIRFFELHYTLSIILVGLVLWYVSLVYSASSSSRYSLTFKKDLQDFGLYFIIKDFFVFTVVLVAFLWIIFYFSNWLGINFDWKQYYSYFLLYLPKNITNFSSLLKNHSIKYPTPLVLSYAWSFGVLAGVFLALQFVAGVLLIFSHNEFVFASNWYVWFLRYFYAVFLSYYFLCIFLFIMYLMSYRAYKNFFYYTFKSAGFPFIFLLVTVILDNMLPLSQLGYEVSKHIINWVTFNPVFGMDISELFSDKILIVEFHFLLSMFVFCTFRFILYKKLPNVYDFYQLFILQVNLWYILIKVNLIFFYLWYLGFKKTSEVIFFFKFQDSWSMVATFGIFVSVIPFIIFIMSKIFKFRFL